MPVYVDCHICGKEFAVPPSRAKTAKACSNKCATLVRAKSRERRIERTCPQCHRVFEIPRSHGDRRRFCSNECREVSEQYQREKGARYSGAGNPRWNGGRHLRADGYIYRHVGADHPFGGSQGYILEHRKVMEDWLRKNDPESHYLTQLGNKLYLSPDYDVHHEDEDRSNNRLDNLRCMHPSEHRKLHQHKRRLAKQG